MPSSPGPSTSPVRLTLSVLCAIFAAIFWGLNFTAIYPVLKIIGSEQNLQQWCDSEIERTRKEIDKLEAEQDDLNKKLLQLAKTLPPGRNRDGLERRTTSDQAKVEGKLEQCRCELYRYQLLKKYIDMIFPNDRFQTLALVIGLVVLAVAIKGFFEFCQETLVGSVVNLSLFDLRNRFFRRAVHLDVQTFEGEGSHEMMARVTNDMELLGAGLKTLFGRVVAEPLRALACIIVACWISWQLTLMFLVLVPIALFILTKVGRVMQRASRRCLERMSSIYKILQEALGGVKVVKACNREPFERQRFVAATALALLAGAYLVLGKHTHIFNIPMTERPLETESLLQLYALLAAIADPVRKLSSVYTRIQSGNAASDRIFQYIDRQPRVTINGTGPRLLR